MMKRFKAISIPGYNLFFDRVTGTMARWGNTKEEDPSMCPLGPEIADIEISTICNGIGSTMETRVPCSWCYKSNTGIGKNMTFETFEKIFSKFGPSLTQIAFGVGDVDGNPDLWRIMEHCRANGVIPNITVNGMGMDIALAHRFANTCGAIAVSHYTDNLCFDTVKMLTDAGMKQVNIHALWSNETKKKCFDLIDKAATDERLKGLKAIVFLLLKPKGNRNRLTSVDNLDDYHALLNHAKERGIAIGMDSCSAPMALKTTEGCDNSIEPCESTLFSIYINTDGEVFPCSFTEGTPGWERGIDAVNINNFLEDVWNHPRLMAWRDRLLNSTSNCSCEKKTGCRACPVYDITVCKPNLVQISSVA